MIGLKTNKSKNAIGNKNGPVANKKSEALKSVQCGGKAFLNLL